MKQKIVLGLRIVAAIILLQTLYFKFTGAPESKFIFSTLGIEPFGRWFAGISELVTCVMLLIPSTAVFGALMATGIMLGAIASHLFILGISVQNDGGLLFSLACIVLIASLTILILSRNQVKNLFLTGKKFLKLS